MKSNLAEAIEDVARTTLAEIPPPAAARHPLEAPLLELAQQLSTSQLRTAVELCVGPLHVAICLHRVAKIARGNWLITPEAELDALIELMRSAKPRGDRPWLTVSFDDGYADAVEYVRSRAPRFRGVEWLLFVCPEKIEKRIGFHWDDRPAEELLASIGELRDLAALPDVHLGNHTNSHRRQVLLSQEEAEHEYRTSRADFVRLFGPPHHFAFPFGTPDREYELRHVTLLRQLDARAVLWSTENRPFAADERKPGAVLPRFPVDGEWTHAQVALWICAKAVRYRLQGTPYRY